MNEAIAVGTGSIEDARASDADRVLKGGWYTLWVMLTLTLFGFIDRQMLTLAAVPVTTSLSLTDSQLGMVQGLAFALFTVLAVYPLAWAADRFDRRIVLGLCLLVWSIGTAACGFARNFEQLFLAAIAIAAGEAGLMPIIVSSIPELFRGRKRILANGLLYFFSTLGVAAGLSLGGGAIGALDAMHDELPAWLRSFEAWRLAFFLVAAPAPILLALLAAARLKHPQGASSAGRDDAADGTSSQILPFLKQHRVAVATVFGALACASLAAGSYLIWLPVAATRMFNTTPAQNGSALGIATACGVIGGVALGTLAVRFMSTRMGPTGTIRFFWIVMTLSTPILIAFPFVSAAWHIFTLFGLIILTSTAIGCMTPTLIQDMAPANLRARLFAVWGIVSGLVAGSAPTLSGFLSTALGAAPRSILIAVSIVAIPSWIVAILVLRLAEQPFTNLVNHFAAKDSPT